MMNKWISISITSILVIGLAASLFLYFQESGNLKDAEAEVSTLEAELAPVAFPDANLDAAILTYLNQAPGPINKFHLEGLTML